MVTVLERNECNEDIALAGVVFEEMSGPQVVWYCMFPNSGLTGDCTLDLDGFKGLGIWSEIVSMSFYSRELYLTLTPMTGRPE